MTAEYNGQGGKFWRRFTGLALAGLIAACSGGSDSTERVTLDRFYRGNTHTHTARSVDSTTPVENMIGWYRDAGYHFVVLTDHDVSAVPGEFYHLETPTFIVIAGEEISSSGFSGGRFKLTHVNSICSNGGTVGGVALGSVADALTDAVNRAIQVAGAVAQINHPTLDDAATALDVLATRATLIEIANQYPTTDDVGSDTRPSPVQLWDQVLSAGMTVYGVASDDSHDMTTYPPGKGWIQVAAESLAPKKICDALQQGRFYASTGVEIESITVELGALHLRIAPGEYETVFSGEDGVVLMSASGSSPAYRFRGDEGYVRATVTSRDGGLAWTQPVYVD